MRGLRSPFLALRSPRSPGYFGPWGPSTRVWPSIDRLLEITESGSALSIKEIGDLTKRTVSMLVMDMSGCHRWLGQTDRLIALHSWALQKSSEIIQQNFGLATPFSGDKVMVFWNVRTVQADHPTLCADAAMRLASCLKSYSADGAGGQNTFGVVNLPYQTPLASEQGIPDGFGPPSFRIACTMGGACFGTMGTETSRAFTILSPCVPRAMVLEKLGKLVPYGVVCDGALHERVHFYHLSRLVGLLVYPDRIPEHRVYELLALRAKKSEPDEWMYELRRQTDDSVGDANLDPLGLRQIYELGSDSASMQLGGGGSFVFRPRGGLSTSQSTSASKEGGNPLQSALVTMTTTSPEQSSPRASSVPPLPTLTGVVPSSPSRGSPSGGASDAVASFYQSHREQLRRLLHPEYGLTMPINLLL